ncbi:MAG: hypothetical protein KBB54_04390, partial [Candidatus Pacebacteria bacterium]|nr:hypothetical protein [Candidatus Paceibacterota bacterium]
STGVIAQELYAIFPEAVSKPADESKGMWAVDYGRITPLIIKSVQELSDIVTAMKIKVEAMFAWFGANGDRFNVKGLVCVDDVCVTKDQFKQFLINTGGTSGAGVPATGIVPGGDAEDSENPEDSENTENGTSTTNGDTNGGGTNGDTGNGGTGTSTTSTPDETETPDEPSSNPQPESVPAQPPTPVVVEPASTPEPAPNPTSAE